MATLRSEASSVERSGAAQGLAEVLAVLGTNHLDALLPDILAGCADRSSPAAREGHLVLLQYLPITLEATLQASLGVRRHVLDRVLCPFNRRFAMLPLWSALDVLYFSFDV
jgi:hypothetical protein